MSFLAVNLLKFGVKKAQKHRQEKKQQQMQQAQQQYNYYPGTEQQQYYPNSHPDKQHQGWYDHSNHGDSEMAQGQWMQQGTLRQEDRVRGIPMTPRLFGNIVLRGFQTVLGLTVVGLYGVDLHHAAQSGKYADSKWVYAQVTSGLSVFTALLHLFSLWILERRMGRTGLTSRPVTHLPLLVWEVILCILWLTLFGIFGKMYLGEDPEGQSGITRMKHAVWVDLVNLLLWCATATCAGLRFFKGKQLRAKETQGQ